MPISPSRGGSVHSNFTFFALTPCVASLSLDLNPVQKAQVQKRIVQECRVYARCTFLAMLAISSININLHFMRFPISFLAHITDLKAKVEKILNKAMSSKKFI